MVERTIHTTRHVTRQISDVRISSPLHQCYPDFSFKVIKEVQVQENLIVGPLFRRKKKRALHSKLEKTKLL